MDLGAQAVEVAEAHDERAPTIRVDPVGIGVAENRGLGPNAQDSQLERNEIGCVLGQRMRGGQLGFHLERTFLDERSVDQLGLLGCQPRCCELVGAEGVTHKLFVGWDGIGGGEPGQPVYKGDFICRWQVEGALTGALDVLRGLGSRSEAEDAIPTEPPG